MYGSLLKQSTVCLDRSISLRFTYSCLFLLSRPQFTPHYPFQPILQLRPKHSYQQLSRLRCALNRCSAAAPCISPQVRLDSVEHLLPPPPVMNKRGDLSPSFISNVMSMHSLLVTEQEMIVERLHGRTHGDFPGIRVHCHDSWSQKRPASAHGANPGGSTNLRINLKGQNSDLALLWIGGISIS